MNRLAGVVSHQCEYAADCFALSRHRADKPVASLTTTHTHTHTHTHAVGALNEFDAESSTTKSSSADDLANVVN